MKRSEPGFVVGAIVIHNVLGSSTLHTFKGSDVLEKIRVPYLTTICEL